MGESRAKLTILFPDQDRITYRLMSEETLHDLGLDTLIREVTIDVKEQAKGNRNRELRTGSRENTLTSFCFPIQ